TFEPGPTYGTGTLFVKVAVGDFNGDGWLDLAAISPGVFPAYDGTVHVWLNQGDGTLLPAAVYSTGSEPLDLLALDVNCDGVLDLVTANHRSASVSVLLGQGDGTFQEPVASVMPEGPASLAAGDFNGDLLPDLVVVYYFQTCPPPPGMCFYSSRGVRLFL